MDRPLKFPRSHRLSGRKQFAAVFDARVRESRGPLMVYGRANGLPHSRLGITISRKVGNAVRRNRIKRLLRESFRQMQHELPQGYDWVVVVRPHEPMALADYQPLLGELTRRVQQKWQRSAKP